MNNLIVRSSNLPDSWKVYRGRSRFGSIVIRMPNGYGASILRDPYRAAPEIAVIKFTGPGDFDWEMTYETPVTNNVELFSSESEAFAILQQIAALPQEIVTL